MKYKYNGQWYDITVKAMDSFPVGTVVLWAGDYGNVPTGWMVCNGASLSRSEYSELFGVIGTTYGYSSSSTFNIPNYMGRVPVGLDITQTEFDTMGETGGSKYLQEHHHSGLTWLGNTAEPITLNPGSTAGGYNISYTGGTNVGQETAILTNNEGIGQSGNLQPYIVQRYIIKVSSTTTLVGSVVNQSSNSTTDTYSCNYVNNIIKKDTITYTTDNNGFIYSALPLSKIVIGCKITVPVSSDAFIIPYCEQGRGCWDFRILQWNLDPVTALNATIDVYYIET